MKEVINLSDNKFLIKRYLGLLIEKLIINYNYKYFVYLVYVVNLIIIPMLS